MCLCINLCTFTVHFRNTIASIWVGAEHRRPRASRLITVYSGVPDLAVGGGGNGPWKVEIDAQSRSWETVLGHLFHGGETGRQINSKFEVDNVDRQVTSGDIVIQDESGAMLQSARSLRADDHIYVKVVGGKRKRKQSLQKMERKVKSVSTWECGVCTFINPSAVTRCKMCNADIAGQQQQQQQQQQPATQAAAKRVGCLYGRVCRHSR